MRPRRRRPHPAWMPPRRADPGGPRPGPPRGGRRHDWPVRRIRTQPSRRDDGVVALAAGKQPRATPDAANGQTPAIVVPLTAEHITDAEYAAWAQDQAADIPPDKLLTVFGMIMYHGDPAVSDTILAGMPVEVQPAIKDLAVQAYAAYATDLYGTPTPPRATS